MKITKYQFSLMCIPFIVGFSVTTIAAEDRSISGHACNPIFNKPSMYKSGYKANKLPAIIACPLTKTVSNNAPLKFVHVRVQRSNVSGPGVYCNVTTYNAFGASQTGAAKKSKENTSFQVLDVPIPSQIGTADGYASVSCVLQPGDIVYGIRYMQSY